MSSTSTRALRACLPLNLALSSPNRIAQRQLSASATNHDPRRQLPLRKTLSQDLVSPSILGQVVEQHSSSAAVAVRSRPEPLELIQNDLSTKRTICSSGTARTTAVQKSLRTVSPSILPRKDIEPDYHATNASAGPAHPALRAKLSSQEKCGEPYLAQRHTKRFIDRKLPVSKASSSRESWSGHAAQNTWPFLPATRHISLQPDGDPEFLPNNTEFSQEWVSLYKRLILPHDGDLSVVQRELEAYRQAAVHFVGHRGYKALRNAWLRLSLGQRVKLLPSILIGCLIESARKTLTLLSILPQFPREWKTRCECLLYLELVHWEEIKRNPDLHSMFANQVRHVSKLRSLPAGTMPRAFLVLLLRHNSPEQCENIIDAVLQNPDPVPVPLILVIVDYFIKQGSAERAIELLSGISVEQRELFKQEILDRLPSLVRLDTIDESGAGRNFKILPRLMKIGMPLDKNMHNCVLQQAVSLRLSNVAWEVFRFMETENIYVDAKSHLVLLRDSFDRQDREKLDKILSAIHQREDLYRDPYLVAYTMHIVRIICCFDRKLPPEVCFAHILAIYDRAYDRAPLVKLGLADPLPVEQPMASQLPEPRPAALGFTVWAYVLCQTDEKPVSRLWHWIAHLIQHKDTSICEAAKHDILYNGFVSFFARHPSTLRKGLEVVEEMNELGLCSATQRTWSEVLCGFLRHGEEDAAEKIWRTMLARGVVPSEHEWSFLLKRYDKSQLSRLVRYVLNERQMPEGLESALDLPDPLDAVSTEAREAPLVDSEWDAEPKLDVGDLRDLGM